MVAWAGAVALEIKRSKEMGYTSEDELTGLAEGLDGCARV